MTRPVGIRRCRCPSSHRTYRAFARCVYRRAEWITGEGPFALVVHCEGLVARLYATREEALSDLSMVDAAGCGGRCRGRHRVVRLVVEALDGQGVLVLGAGAGADQHPAPAPSTGAKR